MLARRRSRAVRNEPGTDTTGPSGSGRGGTWVVGRPDAHRHGGVLLVRGSYVPGTRQAHPRPVEEAHACGRWNRPDPAMVATVARRQCGHRHRSSLRAGSARCRSPQGRGRPARRSRGRPRSLATHRRITDGGRRSALLLSPSRSECPISFDCFRTRHQGRWRARGQPAKWTRLRSGLRLGVGVRTQ